MSQHNAVSKAGRLPALDGLRGFAILLVYLLHYRGGGQSANRLIHAIYTAQGAGWVGVDLFFVLSGFLITGILLEYTPLIDRTKRFYIRRALRIFPIFYLIAIALLALTPIIGAQWKTGHLAYLIYGQNFASLIDPSLDTPGPLISLDHLWSLAVEEQFYLIWPFVIWSMRPRTALKVCIALVLVAPVIRYFVPVAVAYRVVRFDGFAMGAAVAIAVKSGAVIKQWKYLAACITLLVSVMFLSGTVSPVTRGIVAIGITASGLTFSGLLVSAISGGYISRLLSVHWLRLLGRYSYGLYIYHLLWIKAFMLFAPVGMLKQAMWLAGTVAINLTAAILSYHFLEMPFLRLKDRIGRSTETRELAASAP
jgi:peptidoglycan/LPS O-acetylase OafA/YrhL